MDTAAGWPLEILHAMILEDGRRWGDTAAQFQRENATAILGRAGPLQTWIEAPRGARKTTDIAAILLAVLITQAPEMSRSYIGASDLDQALELIDAARGLAERTPELRGEFNFTELTCTYARTGATVTALPADASAFGKRAYLIILDEIANWPETRKARRFWSVLMSGNRKLPECRTIVITNSGDPSHWAWKRRETARISPHWCFSSVPGPLPWLTQIDLAILRENSDTPSEYERLVLNKWMTAEDRLASREDLEACTVLPGPVAPVPGKQYVVTLDIGHTFDPTVMAVMHCEDRPDGRKAVLDLILRWQGSKSSPVDLIDVSGTLIEVATRFNHAEIILDPYSGRQAAQEARAAGLVATEYVFNASSVGKLGLSLHQAIRRHALELPYDEHLLDELGSVRLIKNAVGVYRLDSASGTTHDDQAVVLALGVHHLLDAAPQPEWTILPGSETAEPIRAGETNVFGLQVAAAGTYACPASPDDPWALAHRDIGSYDDETPVRRIVRTIGDTT